MFKGNRNYVMATLGGSTPGIPRGSDHPQAAKSDPLADKNLQPLLADNTKTKQANRRMDLTRFNEQTPGALGRMVKQL